MSSIGVVHHGGDSLSRVVYHVQLRDIIVGGIFDGPD
jgi:hypothetical protein